MATSLGIGGQIVTDGLVFYYDTGNSIDSYLGEPTTNLIPDNDAKDFEGGTDGYWSYQTVAGSGSISTENPKSGTYSAKLTRLGSGGEVNYWWSVGPALSLTPGTTYTFSMDVWCNQPNMAYLYSYLAGTNGTSNFHPGDSKWRRLSMQFIPAASTSAAQIRFGLASNGNYPATAYFDNAQVEQKTHATPFTAGTRSTTGSLLDISGQEVEINLANVSFDSNAQMTFDGTDDQIIVADNTIFDTNNFTVEAVCKLGTFDNNHRTVVAHNASVYSHTNGWWIGTLRNGLGNGNNDFRMFVWGDSSYVVYNDSIGGNDGNYHHLVLSCNSSTVFFYIDGNLVYSTTKPTGNAYTSGQDVLVGKSPNGDNWSGDIPLAKYYNRALTASEVANNYNTLKRRYGL